MEPPCHNPPPLNGSGVLETMGSWAGVIVVLGLGALISGAWMWSHYLKARVEMQREETKRHRDETWLMTQVRLSQEETNRVAAMGDLVRMRWAAQEGRSLPRTPPSKQWNQP